MPEQEQHVFRVRSRTPVDLASGRMVSEPEVIELTPQELEHPHNKRLIDNETLVFLEVKNPLPDPTDAAVRKAEELEVDLTEVVGTGGQDKNQVTVDDVVEFAEKRDSGDPEKNEEENA